jgi:hypothetical protein
LSLFSVVFALLSILTATVGTVEARHLKVYSPYELEKGELEVAYWFDAFLNTPLPESGPFPRQHLLRHTAELAYGLTDRWYSGVYVDFEQPTRGGAEQFTFVQSRLESIYRLVDPIHYWPAIAIYAEYVLPRRQYEHRDEVEFKLLLESRIREFMIRLNPVLEHEFNSSRVEFGYESGIYWFVKSVIRLV